MTSKEVTADDLEKQNPELWAKVQEAVTMYLPTITKDVLGSLIPEPLGTVAEHSTFVRMQETDTSEMFYVEVRTLHMLTGRGSFAVRINKICFYDTFEHYEAARNAMREKNRHTDYNGKKINNS